MSLSALKLLLIGAALSLQLTEILSLSIAHKSHSPFLVHEPPSMRNNYFLESLYNSYKAAHPKPEEVPSENAAPHDSSSDIAKSLDKLTKEIGELVAAAAQTSPAELTDEVKVGDRQLSSEYLVTKGIGAHKLHLRQLSWNKARKVCIDEGGQLADIRSDSEEKILLRMLNEDSVEFAWVGYHDMFEEGDWVSVLGEPFGKSGWDRWWKVRLPNPDNSGPTDNEDCACLMQGGGGLNDNACEKELPFICKITAL